MATQPDHPQPRAKSRWIDMRMVLSMHVPAISMGFGMGATATVLPELTQDFGQTFVAAMMVFVLQQLGTAVAPIPTGFLIDRIGRRKMLLAGPFVVAAASLLTARAAIGGSFEEILVYRFIGGIGDQMWMLSRITVIADTSGAQQRGRQITSMFGVTQIGMLSGPLVGGLTADHFGLWVPFLMHGVIVMVAVIPSFFIIKETMAARSPSGQPGGGRRQGLSMPDLRKPPIPYVFLIQFLANVTRGGIFGGGVIIVYAAFAYDMSPTDIGGLRSAMAVVGIPMTFTAGYIMDRFGRKFTIVPGLTLSGLSMAFLALTDVFDLSRAVFIVAFVAVHLSVSLISGNMQTLGTDVAPAHARGSFFGVSRLIAQIGSLASPVSFTVLVTFATYGAAFALLASSALAGGLVMLTLVPETLRKVGSTPKAQDASQQSPPPPGGPASQ